MGKMNIRLSGAARPWLLAFAVLAAPAPSLAAGSGLYNMDRFLNEPHPFAAAAQPAPAPAAVPPPTSPPTTSAPTGAQPAALEADANDPLEPMNRAVFAFNEFFLEWILGPLATGYRIVTPDVVRQGIGNMLDNLASPTILMNDLLQGQFGRAWETTQRAVINTTLGIGGAFDVAERMGINKHDEDMGQTLAVWGAGEGFYLVLPFFGPSSPRDATGLVVDTFTHPLTLWASNTERDYINYAILGTKTVHTYSTVRDQLDSLRETSVDYYTALRSVYRQRRQAAIANNQPIDPPEID